MPCMDTCTSPTTCLRFTSTAAATLAKPWLPRVLRSSSTSWEVSPTDSPSTYTMPEGTPSPRSMPAADSSRESPFSRM